MRLVGIAHDLRPRTGERGREDRLAERGRRGARPEVVRWRGRWRPRPVPAAWAPSSSSVIAARVAALVEVGLAAIVSTSGATVRWAVGVEVVEHDEPGAGARRSGEDTALQRRELLVPPSVVPRVEAEVDDVGARRRRGW